jgi:D-glycero-alpha-D-manno-heptose-7-phosphate kinase
MNRPEQKPLRIIHSVTPIRICDNGGWTDTWFAEHGKIFNIGVCPCTEAEIQVYPQAARGERCVIHAENYGDHYAWDLTPTAWDRHPLLEASIQYVGIPDGVAVEVTLYSEAPAGASTGTSASIAVALIGALDQLVLKRRTPHEVAYAAHHVETGILSKQSGIQDHLCAAYGGVNYIEVFRYPHATVSQIRLPDPIWWELERRLALVYLGRPHLSSQIHERVIRHLEGTGCMARPLEALRGTAEPARDALSAGDFPALGKAMIQNTEAQRLLHPDLVSPEAQRVVEIAQAHSALGWKVNGAGGDGGSLTILCGVSSAAKRAMIRQIEEDNPLLRSIPIHLSRSGLRVWETPS